MSQPVSPRFHEIVEMVEALPLDEQRQLVEIVSQRLIQYQRAELVAHVAEARLAYRPDQTHRGTAPKRDEFAGTAPRRPTIVRTDRGLSIAGTRITLYDIMDYLTANWPADLIRDWFNLTDRQIADVMAYIEKNRPEVEGEYQLVLDIGSTTVDHVCSGRSAAGEQRPTSLALCPKARHDIADVQSSHAGHRCIGANDS